MSPLLLDFGDETPSVLVEDGLVVDAVVDARDSAGAHRLDCTGSPFAACGAVNAHTHLYSGLAPLGMPAPEPPPDNFVQILERVWWKLDRALDAHSLRASARLYIAEALLNGTTTLIDHHESPELIEGSLDVLADAADELGVRLAVCYGATERNGGADEGARGLRECERFVADNTRPLVRGLVGLHASFTVSDDTIRKAGALSRELATVMHVHVAEDGADVADAEERGYAGPLERLMHLDALPRGSILAHGVHLSPEQVAAASDAGCWLVHNPRSNEGNAVGWSRSLSATDRVALGTDGYPANMWAELDSLMRIAGVEEPGADEAGLLRRLDSGARLAAERFGVPIGEEGPGSAADIVVRNADNSLRHVIVAGRVVVEDSTLVAADIDAIRADAAEQAQRLWERMRAL